MTAAARFVLLTYATPDFEHRRTLLVERALRAGFDRVVSTGPAQFADTQFARENAHIASQPRGAGYWLWKPYYIQKTVATLADDEVLIYSDAGRDNYYRVDPVPTALAQRVKTNGRGFVLGPTVPHHGPISKWTKRDCLALLDADGSTIAERPVVQATWSMWRNTPMAMAFLETWLLACQDARALTDQPNEMGPNHEGFIDHRHDQSILSILAYKHDADIIDLSNTLMMRLMRARPQAMMAHVFLKSLRNVERIERGLPAAGLYLVEIAKQQFARRWRAALRDVKLGNRPVQ